MIAIADRVIVQRIVEEEKGCGIIVPDIARKPLPFGHVLAAGPRCKEVRVGDKVLFEERSVTPMDMGTYGRLGMFESDVLGIVTRWT